MTHVAVLVHSHDEFERKAYWLQAIIECWRSEGINVSVVRDPLTRLDADILVLHVDLTIVPPEYLACARSCGIAINGGVSDISKRRVSTHLLRRGDRCEGPVMIKTNRNDRGRRETYVARKGFTASFQRGNVAGACLDYLREEYRPVRRWFRYGSRKAFFNYPVYDTIADVPDTVWDDDDFVVERFLPETRDGRYCVRTWLFFGNCERHALFYSNDPIVKSHNIIGHERLDGVPEELRLIRQELRFEFGKFDYVIVDGRPVLFDANRTPTIGDFPKDRYLPIARTMAQGIHTFRCTPSAAV